MFSKLTKAGIASLFKRNLQVSHVPKIYYLCPDTNTPSWGIGLIYNHVKILRDKGFHASIIHFEKSFRLCWLNVEVPVFHMKQSQFRFKKSDILVIPEVMVHLPFLKDVVCRKIAHVQNAFYMENAEQGSPDFRDLGIERVFTIMPHIKAILENSYGATAHIVPPFIAPYFFIEDHKLNIEREKIILVYPKQTAQDSYIVLRYIQKWIRAHASEWRVVELKGKSHKEVAGLMARAAFFINVNCREAFNTSVPEAMASGCVCLCYEAYGGRDFLEDGKNAFVFPNNDIYPLIEKTKIVVKNFEINQSEISKMKHSAYATALSYSQEKTANALADYFNSLLN